MLIPFTFLSFVDGFQNLYRHLWSHWDPLVLAGTAAEMKRCLVLANNDDAGANGMWFD